MSSLIPSASLEPAPPRSRVQELPGPALAAPPWSGPLEALFRGYGHTDHQLRALGVSKDTMVRRLLRRVAVAPGPHWIVSRGQGSVRGLASWEDYPWVSEQLGVPTANLRHFVCAGDDPGDAASALLAGLLAAQADATRCLCLRVAVSDRAALRALEGLGFQLLGVELTGVVPVPGRSLASDSDDLLRSLQPRDLPEVRQIASRSHRHNHFRCDERFDPGRVDRMYAALVEARLGCPCQDTLVAERPGEGILGFLSVGWNPHLRREDGGLLGSLDFIAVRRERRLRGLGDLLNKAGLRRLARQGVKAATVRTMANNYAAQGALRKIGFQVSSANFVFHRWQP